MHVELTLLNREIGFRLVVVDPSRLVAADVWELFGLQTHQVEAIVPMGNDRSWSEVVDKVFFRHC